MSYSVAICTFNGEKYLSEQLDSILSQSIKPKQIVVCDDGSTDKTNIIVSHFTINHPEINWKHKKNDVQMGVIKNFEQAINLCDEEIVFLSDQDDVWLQNKAEKVLNVLSKNQYSVIFTDARIVDVNCTQLGLTMFQKIDFKIDEQLKFHKSNWSMYLLLSKYHATGATMAFKKSIVQKFMPFPINTSYYHDAWIATLAACIGELTFINEPLILYRQHENQQIGAKLNTVAGLQKVHKYGIIESLIAKRNSENVIYEFFKVNQDCISNNRFLVLHKRNRIYNDLILNSSSFYKRFLIVICLRPYVYKLQGFMGGKMFFIHSLKYLFSASRINYSDNEIDV